MNSTAPAVSKRGRKKPADADVPVVPVDQDATIAETAVRLIPYHRLERAPENVRHTREAEDVAELADDIAAHGLLQSLIGYEQADPAPFTEPQVYIVGGGRRLGALALLDTRGLIPADYRVPVLVRDEAEAVELSLAENLARRDMSPVDEFLAFDHLMKAGTNSPEILAKRFGFSEKYVRQRLRLANLAPPVLDALRERRITLDAAMVYARSADTEVQAAIFKAQDKSGHEPHRPDRIKWAITTAQLSDESELFKFIGADTYEAAGGSYEDDLFADAGGPTSSYDRGRKLTHGGLVTTLAGQMVDEAAPTVLADFKAQHPTVVGYTMPPAIGIDGYGWKAPKPPAGYVMVEAEYGLSAEDLWARIADHNVETHVILGLSRGKVAIATGKVFVPKESLSKVKPPRPEGERYVPPTPEQMEARRRASDVETWSRRLALPEFANSGLAGRVFWPPVYQQATERLVHPVLGEGFAVITYIFVSAEEAQAQRVAAEAKVDAIAAESRAAEEERRQLEAEAEQAEEEAGAVRTAAAQAIADMDPEPEVVIADGEAWFRWITGEYSTSREGDPDPDMICDELTELLDNAEGIGPAYATVEAFEAAVAETPELVGMAA